MRKRIKVELGGRHLEVEGDKAGYLPRRNRLIITSGWNDDGAFLNISTAPLKSQSWPNAVNLSGQDWKRVARAVARIITHCEREKRRQD